MKNLENYQKENLTLNLVSLNVIGVLSIIPITLLYGIPYYLLWELPDIMSFFKTVSVLQLVTVTTLISILGTVIHELIHGITWARFTQNGFRSIKFGVVWKALTPYCHCKEPLQVKQYVLGTIMPAIVLGFIPAILAILTGNFLLLIFGIVFTMGAIGDFLIIYSLRNEHKEDFVLDHPDEAGCIVYRAV